MIKTCKHCSVKYEVTDEDLKFYDKVSPVLNGERYQIPAPTHCPGCRQQRRLAFRNERKLYHRKCDLTGKQIISMYSPDKKFLVYDQEAWWSDQWNPFEYGKEFDFSRSFFEQFHDLLQCVPRVAILNRNSENSEYTNISADNKNCYLLVESSNNEDCLYSYWMQKCVGCVDSSYCSNCE